ncbi:OmpA family protein [Ekhidna sp.]|uniref:OmpA family protein n=1 Tax=Ekhidna sp. TaxID=2608089 RepID=UPI0032EE2396
MENIPTDSQIHGHSLIRGSLFIALLLFILSLSAQSLSTENRKAQKLYEKADKKYKDRDFYAALELLEESVLEDARFFEAYIRMGSLYNAIGEEDSVYSKFQRYFETAPDPIASVVEKLAFMAFDRGEYQKAENFLDHFLARVPERASSYEIDLLSKSIDFAKDQILNPMDSIIVELLPSNVNRFKLQYLPSVTIDNSSIFYTKRDNVNGDEDIVVSYFRDGQWSPAQSVSDRINSPLNEGACTVSADGRTMIFTSCDGKNSFGSCDLYISKKVGDVWSYPKNLGNPVNTIYWESQPSLSADGKTLYFSSNRRGGFGGRDIWVSKNSNGDWSSPINLGSQVNTIKDETTPFMHPNGTSLYFSANGYPGMGGYDLYKSEKTDSTWSTPQNLGFPINTYKDEVSIVISADGLSAYYAKEEQKNYEILDSKLVSIDLPNQIRSNAASYVVGHIVDVKTGNPLKADVQVVDLATNEILYESQSDSLTGVYYMVLPVGLDLAGYVKKKGYLYSDFHFVTEVNSVSEPDSIEIELVPVDVGEKLILKNIYFEVDSYQLNNKSLSEIENAYQLLKENPKIEVEIAGHTDDVGARAYNQRLSELRAKEVYSRLIGRGIESNRLSFKGYADTQPIKPNTTESNRQSNRRIEFRVLRTKL